MVILLTACAAIAVSALLFVRDSEFGGADGQAEEVIGEISPDYEPWAEPVIELPGGETESLIFCLQAALGGGVLGYGFGYLRSRKKFSENNNGAKKA